MSADQIAAQAFGKDTPLPSLELAIDLNFLGGQCENSYSCAYMNTLAWRSPTSPLPTENNPRIVFERLFGDGGTTAQRVAQARENRSILDSVTADFAPARSTLGPADRTQVDDVRRFRARGRAAHHRGRDARRRRRPAGARAAARHPGALRRAREADVRAAVARVPGRHHARRDVHARPRAELPHLSGDRRHRRPSRPVAPRRPARADREAREAQHLSGGAVRVVPREAAVDARRRRHPARSLAVPLRRRPEQPEPARALRPAADAASAAPAARSRAAGTSCSRPRRR